MIRYDKDGKVQRGIVPVQDNRLIVEALWSDVVTKAELADALDAANAEIQRLRPVRRIPSDPAAFWFDRAKEAESVFLELQAALADYNDGRVPLTRADKRFEAAWSRAKAMIDSWGRDG